MPRKKKYENAEIVKEILARETSHLGDLKSSLVYRFLDLKKKEDREFLKRQAEEILEIFKSAIEELEK